MQHATVTVKHGAHSHPTQSNQPGDQSEWRHCSVRSTGYGLRSEFSFVCASWLTAAFMAAHHHTSLRHCVWRRHGITSSPAVRVYIEPNGSAITTSYIGRPGIPRGCGTSLELITDIRRISVIISDIPAQSEVAAVQCVFSTRLNIGLTVLLLLLCNWHLTNTLLATTTCVQCPCNSCVIIVSL